MTKQTTSSRLFFRSHGFLFTQFINDLHNFMYDDSSNLNDDVEITFTFESIIEPEILISNYKD
jgi:hypothetical protein